VKPEAIRTSIDLPREVHRRLHELAACKGCSARQLILASIARVIDEAEPAGLNLGSSLIPPAGRQIDLTNDQLYELIELP
jgi:hypothetical protein